MIEFKNSDGFVYSTEITDTDNGAHLNAVTSFNIHGSVKGGLTAKVGLCSLTTKILVEKDQVEFLHELMGRIKTEMLIDGDDWFELTPSVKHPGYYVLKHKGVEE